MPKLFRHVNRHEPGLYRQRFKQVFIVVCIVLSVLVLRLWYLQIIKGDEMTKKSETNSIRVCKIMPLRGLITDRYGNVLVDNQPSFDIVFIPDKNRDLKVVAGQLQSLYREHALQCTEDFSRLRPEKMFTPVRLDRNVDLKKLALVETRSLDLPGVGIEIVPTRQYLYGEMMAHLIGYVGEISSTELAMAVDKGYKTGDIVGKYGIEKFFNNYLKGENGAEEVEVNALGKKIKILRRFEPKQGYSLRLTLDASLQQVAWEAFEGKPGAAVVMDTRNGEILALVSSPSFDPNLFNGGISHREWRKILSNRHHPMENRAISGQYPPGSTYKLVVAAAALEEGLISPGTSISCDGTFELGNRTFRCWKKEGHGRVNLHRAIVESCDVYFYALGKQLGVDKIAHYARAFGFGTPTGISLTREKRGIVPTKEWKLTKTRQPWQMGETVSVAIGQGFNLVTPLQLASFYAALANGGILYRPRLVTRIDGPDGQRFWRSSPEKISRIPISQKNREILNRALWGVVNENGGTGYALRRPEKDVCGKTGTSQVVGLPMDERARKAKILSGAYQDHALFVCFAPYDHPEIVVSVIAENAGHGGSAAAPIARKIIDAYFSNKQGQLKEPSFRIQRRPPAKLDVPPEEKEPDVPSLTCNRASSYNPNQSAMR